MAAYPKFGELKAKPAQTVAPAIQAQVDRMAGKSSAAPAASPAPAAPAKPMPKPLPQQAAPQAQMNAVDRMAAYKRMAA